MIGPLQNASVAGERGGQLKCHVVISGGRASEVMMQISLGRPERVLGKTLVRFDARGLQIAEVEVEVTEVIGRDQDGHGHLRSPFVGLDDLALTESAAQFIGTGSGQGVVIAAVTALAPV